MNGNISIAILGSTGYVGLELVKILSHHPKVKINFLGSNSHSGKSISEFSQNINIKSLPNIQLNSEINLLDTDIIFLA